MENNMRLIKLPVILLLLFGFAAGENLGKDGYLTQVREGNLLLKAALTSADSARKQIEEQKLLTSPWAFSGFRHGLDKSPSVDAIAQIDTKVFDELTFGLEQRTDIGFSARVYYDIQYYSLEGITPLVINLGGTTVSLNLITTPRYYSNKLAAEVKLDLLRNGFGSEVRSTKKAIEAKNEAVYFEKMYQAKQVLMQAELAYWELSLARETVKIHEQLLNRANQLDSWMQNKIYLNLQDQSDINQSKSEVQYRKLELKGALDTEKSAARTFNYLRGKDIGKVEEVLDLPGEKDLSSDLKISDPEKRLDYIALLRNLEAVKAGTAAKKEVLSSELSIGASASLNAVDSDLPTAWSNSFRGDKYVYGAGINLRVPLDFPTDALSKAYDGEWKSLELYSEAKRLEIKTEFLELNRKLIDVKERLILAVELERLQKNKANAERDRLSKGNSVTAQVLMFEQDWSKSQLGVLEIKKGILNIIARLRLFEEFKGE
ncbi:MAG: hypothetical protein A2452_05285 [Candidatus Firestonebacteria bacterium RIFOXYC2_FULL_39_67]|nr:MAG: hypothetical protein A2536_10985 [Candidatus Firestonebacteria bacterium RIFOXYD2_FULL_39_29]OGF54439.1 MAG: hypothetical protein A2452_05285 [Candidatus Firestonebacteria bacterium RIFOXYC2_FULL_39_67]